MDDRHAQPETTIGLKGPSPPTEVGEDFAPPWQDGAATQIEARLLKVPDTERGPLLESMIAREVRGRRGAGEDPAVAEYLRRFPGQTELVARAFGLRARRDEPPPDVPSTEDQTLSVDAGGDDPGTEIEAGALVGRRYAIRGVLGKGGCAIVYLAHDPMLDRLVALKMPRSDGFRSEADLAGFIREARNAAQLVIPGIVQTYDVQSEPGSIFIVQQYIDGPSLSALMKAGRMPAERAVDLMVGVAAALDHAHRLGFIHRDIKPANILLDATGRPHLGDFGLALHESTQRDHWGELAGTCPYMSPEQVRREVHRLDGRSDLWSLGIIFYELLTGRRPFTSTKSSDLFEEIERVDPRPPRELDPAVPEELSRVCMKCLAKRTTDRYASAAELTDDLRHWRGGDRARAERDAAEAARVVPKGLRSFDAVDKEFFLELLPGPRDREGLPEGLRFWKRQLERVEADERLAVCLMYGPSGSGKSSLVKAGLIPRLAAHVLPIYVEATPGETESRLLRALRSHDPAIPAEASLPEALERLRSAGGLGGRKVLVVLDQFEQWLHATGGRGEGPLFRALRQCDGGGVQCLLLVRDDFWMSITRFMQCLEVPQVEGLNSAAVDLFDPGHARKVLGAFGRAFAALPEGAATAEQERFLDQSVRGLTRDGKVITVRLALYAEMMKGRPWTPAGLEEVGGPEGVDLSFLEQTFSAPGAPPGHRQHEHAARAVLKALLPEHGSDIRGRMQPVERLLEASGYAESPDDFRALLEILDGELRLITPTEPDGLSAGAGGGPAGAGHALLPTDPRLPHPGPPRLADDEAARDAEGPRRGPAGGADGPLDRPPRAEAAPLVVGVGRHPRAHPAGRLDRAAADDDAGGLDAPPGPLGPGAAGRPRARGRRARGEPPRRRAVAAGPGPGPRPAALGVRLALAAAAPRPDGRPAGPLEGRGRAGRGRDGRGVGAADPRLPGARPPRRGRGRLPPGPAPRRRRARAGGDPRRAPPLEAPRRPRALEPRARPALGGEGPARGRPGAGRLRPGRRALGLDRRAGRRGAARLRPAARQPVGRGAPARPRGAPAAPGRGLRRPLPGGAPPVDRRRHPGELREHRPRLPGHRGAGAARRRRLAGADGDPPAARRAAPRRADRPAGRRHQGPRPDGGRRRGRAPDPPPGERGRGAPGPRPRRLVLAPPAAVRRPEAADAAARRDRPRLVGLRGPARPDRAGGGRPGPAGDPHRPGADEARPRARAAPRRRPARGDLPRRPRRRRPRRAAEWVLTRWGFGDRVADVRRSLAGKPRGKRGWYVTGQLHTMIVIPAPGRFRFGMAEHERCPSDDNPDRGQDERSIDSDFAISAHEVTREQFEHYKAGLLLGRSVPPEPDCPMNYVSWYDAARYCRWLSERPEEGIPESERCYPPADEIKFPLKLAPGGDHLRKGGYRLPTVEEWEFVARSWAATSRFFGNSPDDLDNYAWWAHNADERIWPVGRLRPNPLGLFDVYGNVYEWCDLVVSPPHDPRAGNRGGCYRSTAKFLRSAMPEWTELAENYSNHGFRIVRAAPPP